MGTLDMGECIPNMDKFTKQLELIGLNVEIHPKGKKHTQSDRIYNYEVHNIESIQSGCPTDATSEESHTRILNNMPLTLYTISQIIKNNRECLAIAESLTTERTFSECYQFAVECGANLFLESSYTWPGNQSLKNAGTVKIFEFGKIRATLEDLCWALVSSWTASNSCRIQVNHHSSLSALVLLMLIIRKLPYLHQLVCIMLVDESDDSVVYTGNNDFIGSQECEIQTPEHKLLNPFGSTANSAFVIFENADIDSAANACLRGHFFSNNKSSYSISQVLVQSSIKQSFIESVRRVSKQAIYTGHFIDENCDVTSERIDMTKANQTLLVETKNEADGMSRITFGIDDGTDTSVKLPALNIKEFTTVDAAFKKLSSYPFTYASVWTNSLMLGMECINEIRGVPQILINQTISPESISFTWLNELKTQLWSVSKPTLDVPSLMSSQSSPEEEVPANVLSFFSNDVYKTVEVLTELNHSQSSLIIDATEQESLDVKRVLSTALNLGIYRKFNCWSSWWSVLIKITSQMRYNSEEMCAAVAALCKCDVASMKLRFVSWSQDMLSFFSNMHSREMSGGKSILNHSCTFTVIRSRGMVAICVYDAADCGQLFALALLAATYGNSVILACRKRCPALVQLGKVLNNCGIPAGMITFMSGLSAQSMDKIRSAATVIWEISSDCDRPADNKRTKSQWTFSCVPKMLHKFACQICTCDTMQIVMPADFKHGS